MISKRLHPASFSNVNAQLAQMPNLLAEYEVTGSAVTQIDFTGLDIKTHKSYQIEVEIINPTASSTSLKFCINGDTTNTNYYTQEIVAGSTSLSAQRSNAPYIGYTLAGKYGYSNGFISLVNGYLKANIYENRHDATSVNIAQYSIVKTATVTNITQITLISTIANAIGVGSKVRIYRGDK